MKYLFAIVLATVALVAACSPSTPTPADEAVATAPAPLLDTPDELVAYDPADAPVADEVVVAEAVADEFAADEVVALDPQDYAIFGPEQPEAAPEVSLEEVSLEEVAVGQSANRRQRTARLIIITNFERATVTVNGQHYPAYFESDEEEGMVLPVGTHEVLVTHNGNTRSYEIDLRANERRLMMVDLTGFRGNATGSVTPPPTPPAKEEPEVVEEDGEQGRVTVYAKPRGTIFVGDRDTGIMTPGTVDVDGGRHDVQVRYEDGQMSEKKVVRVRSGSRIKLFFRQN